MQEIEVQKDQPLALCEKIFLLLVLAIVIAILYWIFKKKDPERPIVINNVVVMEKEKPVVVEKMVYVDRPIDRVVERLVEKPVLVEKEIIVEKPVLIEKERVIFVERKTDERCEDQSFKHKERERIYKSLFSLTNTN